MSAEARAFSYRVIVPPLWALFAVAAVELVVTHLLLAHWTTQGAVALSAVSLAFMAWLLRGIVSMPHLPVLVGDDALVMRAGRIKGARVPMAQVRGFRAEWSAAELKRRDVLNLALLSHPNVLVDLTAPLPGRRGVTAIAHRLDDPVGFASALETTRMRTQDNATS